MKKQDSNVVQLTGKLYSVNGNNIILEIPRTKGDTLDYVQVQVKNMPNFAEGAIGMNFVSIDGRLGVAYSSDPNKRYVRDTIIQALDAIEVNIDSIPVNAFEVSGRVVSVSLRETTKNVLIADIIVKCNNLNFKCVAFYERALAAQNLINQNVVVTGMLQYRQLRNMKDVIDLSVFTIAAAKGE